MNRPEPSTIAVVGSLNLDFTVAVDRLPVPGETRLGTGLQTGPGGKGGNQAVAAARLGGEVSMVGRLGDDPEGVRLREALLAEGVEVAGITIDPRRPSGMAFVVVDGSGENAIVVAPGANAGLTASDVEKAGTVLARARVTLVQLEIPLDAVEVAVRRSSGTVVLNPAPARTLPGDLLAGVDVLVPNRVELAMLAGAEPAVDVEEVVAQAEAIDGPACVVVTMGAEGAVTVDRTRPRRVIHHLDAVPAAVVDTTGAGDAFCGGLAVAIAEGRSLVEAARFANGVAARATTRVGAQAALPRRDEL